jgi:hypothetical protein
MFRAAGGSGMEAVPLVVAESLVVNEICSADTVGVRESDSDDVIETSGDAE